VKNRRQDIATSRKKGEQIKMYIVIGLLLVLLSVAYFRFLHNRRPSEVGQTPPTAALPQFDVAHVQMEIPKTAPRAESTPDEPLPAVIRDIFAPLRPLEEPEGPVGEQKSARQALSLKLKGTIVGDEKSIAIINDQFVRTGDFIGEYEVVRIAKHRVLLKSADHQIALEVLENKPR
jgi:hypothetical protein